MESISHPPENLDAGSARAALDAVAVSRAEAAARIACPWWYHVGLGVTVALLFLSMSLRMASWAVPLLTGVMVALGWAVPRATGVSLRRSTSTPGATLLFGLYALAVLLLAVTGMSLEWGADLRGAIGCAGLVIGTLTIVVGYRIDAAAQRDIRAGR
ncbi:hypothetical protein AB0G35_35400 [Streptomyces sp. NPDC021749]|uniref:hypothetical protein n=1 Tax=Streptomyces sp. NPDC021749 TaxID=3154905 RepID=UPI0033E0A6C0